MRPSSHGLWDPLCKMIGGSFRPVARFMLASLAAVAVIVVGGYFALREVGLDEAERDTATGCGPRRAWWRRRVSRRHPAGQAGGDRQLDDLVLARILTDEVVRVKLWSKDGRILYSDEPALIGKKYGLGDDELELFETGGADAELSDLEQAREPVRAAAGEAARGAHADPDAGRYAGPVRDLPAFRLGQPERGAAAERAGAAAARRAARADVAPAAARVDDGARLERGHIEREGLLASAAEASTHERRRIAADLHDGVVQDLAGIAFGLAPLTEERNVAAMTRRRRHCETPRRPFSRECATCARCSSRSIRRTSRRPGSRSRSATS